MEELNEQLQIVRSNTVNSKSKSVYLYGIVKYILWLHATKPDILQILLSLVVAEDDDEAYGEGLHGIQLQIISCESIGC
ncbi:hypothetical protein GQ600_1676 [Phytophthora cactorum]|nr:hypothetical protein GQ600_1676 [Phytophthora cactorum]